MLKADVVDVLKGDVDVLKGDVAKIKTTVGRIETNQQEMRIDIGRIETNQVNSKRERLMFFWLTSASTAVIAVLTAFLAKIIVLV